MPFCRLMFSMTLLASLTVVVGCNGNSQMRDEARAHHLTRYDEMKSNIYLQGAERDFNAGDLSAAESTLRAVMAADTQNPRVYLLAGRIAIERGQLERAVILLRQTIELDANNAEAYYYMGVVNQRWQRFVVALDNYRQAYERRPDHIRFLMPIGEMLVTLGRSNEALELLKGKEVYFESSSGILMAIGQILYIQGRYAEAAEYFRKASIMEPDDARILEELANAQMSARQIGPATLTLEKLLTFAEHKDNLDLRRRLARAYIIGERLADAKRLLMAMTRENPNDVDAWVLLGETAWAQKDLSGALYAANRLTRIAPQRHEGYLLGGLVWQQRDALDRALENFDRAAHVAPEEATPLILRGMTLEQQGQRAQAAEAYREALRRRPDDARAIRLLAGVDTSGQ